MSDLLIRERFIATIHAARIIKTNRRDMLKFFMYAFTEGYARCLEVNKCGLNK